MASTLLQLMNAAQAEMNLTVTTSIIGNQSTDVVQTLALINAAGNELQREYEWQALGQEYIFQSQVISTTGNTQANSAVVTNILPNTTGLDSTFQCVGTGINNASNILSVDSSSQVTLTQPATVNGTNATLTFSKVKYSYPTDFDRLVDGTDWDKTQHWQMIGPESAQQWAWLKSGYISSGPRVRFRPLRGYFQLWPALGVSHSLGFEYISKNWVFGVADTQPSKTAFAADTDTCIYPDRLIISLLKLKYWAVKGFDMTAFAADYQRQSTISKSADAGSANLSMSPKLSSVLLGFDNIPDTNYGS